MVAIFIKTAASLATGLLGFASLRNMAETYYICRPPSVGLPFSIPRLSGNNCMILDEYMSINEKTNECRIAIPQNKSDQDVIHDLKQMPRRDLIKLFLYCTVPNDLDEICGNWDGILLNNNFILTSVSKFITNQLFGINYNGGWFGKTFDDTIVKNSINQKPIGIGENRFLNKKDADSNSIVRKRHKFEYSKSKSKLKGNGILLDYSSYQNFLSPWWTMKDEIRILRSNNVKGGGKEVTILLGIV